MDRGSSEWFFFNLMRYRQDRELTRIEFHYCVDMYEERIQAGSMPMGFCFVIRLLRRPCEDPKSNHNDLR
jgi:hypothetical protein